MLRRAALHLPGLRNSVDASVYGIFYAPHHKSCYTPLLRDTVVFVLLFVTISLKTTPEMVGAVRSFYVF
jgi:hypothetical protein